MNKLKTAFRKLKIKTKLLLSIIGASIAIYAVAFGYMSLLLRKNEMTDAKIIMDSYAREYANLAKANINVEMNIVRGIAQAFMGYKSIPISVRMPIYKDILKNVAVENKDFLSVWTNWELNTVDSSWNLPYGRMRYTYYRANNVLNFKIDILNKDGDNPASSYYQMKMSGIETVLDPYFYSYTKKKEDEILETSVCCPILDNNKFVGVVGVDLSLGRFQEIINKINPYDESYAFLIANNGVYVAHTDKSIVGKTIMEVDPDNDKKFRLSEKIKSGETFSNEQIQVVDDEEVNYYVSYAPIAIGKSITPWTLGIAVPLNVVMQKAKITFIKSILVGLFGILLLALIIWLLASTITKPIITVTNSIKNISLGAFEENNKINIKNEDELGEMANALNNLIIGLNKTSKFAEEIGKGNLETKYNPLSDKDILGNSLLYMQSSLKKAEIDEITRKIEDDKRNWVNTGITNFSDILRQNNWDLEVLSYEIIRNLVNYLKAVQGGLFVTNDEDENNIFLELKACYAYDRQKFLTKKIGSGEGLAGMCFKESKTVYLTEVPSNYLSITSGLGNSKPQALLIVPLKLNEKNYGVIEISSLKKFEKHEIEFVEKIAESIASTIASVKTNIKTNSLLRQSQEQSEEMRAQEEEMRQNMEELNATQEEMQRKNDELQNLVKTIDATLGYVELDVEGNVIKTNDLYLKEMGNFKAEDLIGHNRKEFVSLEESKSIEYQNFWNDVINGETKKWTKSFKLPGNDRTYWKLETFTPVFNTQGRVFRVICAVMDITEFKENEFQAKKMLDIANETIKNLSPKNI